MAAVLGAPDALGAPAQEAALSPALQAPHAPPAFQERHAAPPWLELTGRVVKGRASEPVTGIEVELHRITAHDAGVVARQTTNRSGRFHVRLDTAAEPGFRVYLVTARYDDVLYIGDPVPARVAPEEDYLLRVYEARTADSLPVEARHLAVAPDPAGFRVVDVFEVANPSDTTLVPPDPPGEGWTLRLPSGARDIELERAGVEGEEVRLEGHGVALRSPVPPPGRTVVVRYRIPAGPMTLVTDRSYPLLELLLPADARNLTVSGLVAASPAVLGESTYLRFAATDLAPGSTVKLQSSGADGLPWGWILLGLSLACAGAAILTHRKPRRP